MLAQVNKR